jgi:hypothetical protein
MLKPCPFNRLPLVDAWSRGLDLGGSLSRYTLAVLPLRAVLQLENKAHRQRERIVYNITGAVALSLDKSGASILG